jgi:hypothetical protein
MQIINESRLPQQNQFNEQRLSPLREDVDSADNRLSDDEHCIGKQSDLNCGGQLWTRLVTSLGEEYFSISLDLGLIEFTNCSPFQLFCALPCPALPHILETVPHASSDAIASF